VAGGNTKCRGSNRASPEPPAEINRKLLKGTMPPEYEVNKKESGDDV
jgi:hypothetical protein